MSLVKWFNLFLFFFSFLPEIKVQMFSVACEQSDLTTWWLSVLSLFMESFCNFLLLCLYETYSCGSQSCALIYLQTQWKDFAVQDEQETFSLFMNTRMAFSALSVPFCTSVKRLNNKGLFLWAMGQDFLAKLKQRYFTEEICVRVQWGCSDWSPNEYLLLSFENILMGGLCAPLKCCSVLGFKQMCDKPNRVLPQHSVILYVTTTRPMKNMKVLKLHSCLCSGSKHNTWAYR